ncbi:hypothetical protein [Streptomyces luteireticuli]|uniref:hypothetical protein n=1 Tax=Streptomyces luteireticuli TaxID=173858 RepID=UPI003557B8A3
MAYTELKAETALGTKDILRSARTEIIAEMRRRHPGDTDAQFKALDLPLRMTIHFGLADLDSHHPAKGATPVSSATLTAATARGARDILSSALDRLEAEILRRHPGDTRAQLAALEAPLRTVVHYDIADLDLDGPLSVDACLHPPYDAAPRALTGPTPDGSTHSVTTPGSPAGQGDVADTAPASSRAPLWKAALDLLRPGRTGAAAAPSGPDKPHPDSHHA